MAGVKGLSSGFKSSLGFLSLLVVENLSVLLKVTPNFPCSWLLRVFQCF